MNDADALLHLVVPTIGFVLAMAAMVMALAR